MTDDADRLLYYEHRAWRRRAGLTPSRRFCRLMKRLRRQQGCVGWVWAGWGEEEAA